MGYELIGICGSLWIVISMSFPSTEKRKNILMRVLNMVGSACFVVYGLLIPAYSTALVNFIMIFINLLNIYKLVRRGNDN